MTLASHLKRREGPIESICHCAKDDQEDPGQLRGMSLLEEARALGGGSGSCRWLCRKGQKEGTRRAALITSPSLTQKMGHSGDSGG